MKLQDNRRHKNLVILDTERRGAKTCCSSSLLPSEGHVASYSWVTWQSCLCWAITIKYLEQMISAKDSCCLLLRSNTPPGYIFPAVFFPWKKGSVHLCLQDDGGSDDSMVLTTLLSSGGQVLKVSFSFCCTSEDTAARAEPDLSPQKEP